VYLPQPRIRSKVDSEYKNQLFLASGSNFGERQEQKCREVRNDLRYILWRNA
jgi:hypothetical protein